jgi:hypothetical protein
VTWAGERRPPRPRPVADPAQHLLRLLQRHPPTPRLRRRTPAEAYAARPRAAASGIPLIDGHFRVRHDTIDTNGKLTLRYNSRLHHISLGRRYAGQPVLVPVHDTHICVLSTSGQLLRDLALDPTRDYQPQARP